MIINNQPQINPAPIRPGTVVSTPRAFYKHVGVTTNRYINGWPTVISNTGKFGKVVEESLAEFLQGHGLQIEGYWGNLPEHAVLARAESKVGSPYMLFSWNCEHFVRFAHGLEEESPQIQNAMIGAVTVGFLIALTKKA